MKQKRIGIIMHGVTGRMGMDQHLLRSILELYRAAKRAGIRHGVVQDKLWLPGSS